MDARTIAAQFAAFTWFNECHVGRKSNRAATKFALGNWPAFLDHVPEGFGRLLIRISLDKASMRGSRGRRAHRKHTGPYGSMSMEAAG